MKGKHTKVRKWLALIIAVVFIFQGGMSVYAAEDNTELENEENLNNNEDEEITDNPQSVSLEYIFEVSTSNGKDVFVQLGNETDVFSELKLSVEKGGVEQEVEPDEVIENVAAFHLEENVKLLSIAGLVNASSFITALTELDESEGVELPVNDEDIIIDDYVSENINEDETSITEAAENANAAIPATMSVGKARTTSANKVVVIDPGHSKTSVGTRRTYNGVIYKEEEIVYKIAQYAKEELEKYSGVTVYLTRDESGSPSIEERVKFAQSKGASILVSIHINATETDTTTATGVEAMVAKIGTYNTSNAQSGQVLARSILDELVALGFKDRGFVLRESSETYYSDGSKADYYGIVRYGQIYSVPSIIVEHGFINNESDLERMKTEVGLQSMGAADAKGIANYLGLSSYSGSTGWYTENGKTYFLGSDGKPVTGTPIIDGKKYWFDVNGVQRTGWLYLNNWKMYFDPSTGEAKTGMAAIDGKRYLFNDDGVMQNYAGTPVINGKKYWFSTDDESLKSGWLYLLNWKMYFDPVTYEAKTGMADINEKRYLFNGDGVMQNYAGTTVINGKKYWFSTDDASLKTGWLKLGNWYLYFDPTTYQAAVGWTTIEGKQYYFDENGVMREGFVKIGDYQYYLKQDGTYATGTPIINGKKYAFDGSGRQIFGWYSFLNWEFYFDPDNNGAAVTTSIKIDDTTYYFNSDGTLQSSSTSAYLSLKDPANGKTYTLEPQFSTDPIVGDDKFLAAAIYTESGNQTLECQIATGLVILNRMESNSYPNTLRYVIYQKTQFEVARNGSLTKILQAYANNDTTQLKWVKKSEEAAEKAKQIMNAYKKDSTPRLIEGVVMPNGKTDFDYLGFMTPAAFERLELDPVKTEAFQIDQVMFFTKWIKKES